MTEIDVDIDTTDLVDADPDLTALVPAIGTARPLAALVEAGTVRLAPTLLTSRDKEEIARHGWSFTLLALAGARDESGGYWAHLIELDGNLCTFRLQRHAFRDDTARGLLDALLDGPVSGMTLVSRAEKLGNHFLVLAPASPPA